VEQRSIFCFPPDACTDRLVDWGGSVSTLSSLSGECFRKLEAD
jgi:hypothetical protein